MLQGLLQRSFVFHVESSLGSINLPQKAAKHFPGTDFDKGGDALSDQQAHRWLPQHGSCDLADERVSRAVGILDQNGVDI